ncbi:hypothetical protein DVK00_05050 [Haloarcula sp. Atlit-47R]|uniref:hypothetical protein n=1 Tax=Haloarcula sp. Atlit-47R TaxID=2282132 RepID=UPI000FEF1C44|nr:hypothetical protein [Haloarcula sp. Atlit-47R]RLM47873.1 hypothetical protein DVK00_05050 [Haloarcula sp. Atlit-47R]
MDLFRELADYSDAASFDAIDNRQNILRVNGEKLPTSLEIRIEPQTTFEQGLESSERYEVSVSTYTDMTFGYRSNDPLDEFRTLSEDILRVIQREQFDNAQPESTFLTGAIKGDIPTEEDQIEDEDIQMRAKVRGDEIEMTFRDPRNLTRGIQKYVQPL